MKKVICDICRKDINYNGIKVIFVNIFKFLFRRVLLISKHGTDFDRIDLCENCFNKLRQLVLNPNTIQDLREALLQRRRLASSPEVDIHTAPEMPEPIPVSTRQAGSANGR